MSTTPLSLPATGMPASRGPRPRQAPLGRAATGLLLLAAALTVGALRTQAAVAASLPVTTQPEASPTTPGPSPTTPIAGVDSVPIAFTVRGAAEVRTGIRGKVSISGGFRGSLDRSSGAFSGEFSLIPTVADVMVLGLIPVKAETDWWFTEPVTGQWRDGVMTMRVAARIHHPRLIAFGQVIAGGPDCATKRASVIELRSDATAPVLDPLGGATLSTYGRGFSISGLSGCGWMDGLLSAIAAGSGNQATIELTRAPVA